MSGKSEYQPPHTITPAIVNLLAEISETVGRLSALKNAAKALQLLRINRIRTIRGSLAIEGTTLSYEQIIAILDGKRIISQPWEIQKPRTAPKRPRPAGSQIVPRALNQARTC